MQPAFPFIPKKFFCAARIEKMRKEEKNRASMSIPVRAGNIGQK